MAGYRDLLDTGTFLDIRRRAAQVRPVDLRSIRFSEKELEFNCNSVTTPGQIWIQRVRIPEVDRRKLSTYTHAELTNIIRNSNILVDCDCPAWTYWGFAYKSTLEGYGIKKESRFPKVRNPNLEGKVCKHARAVMQVYPFLSNSIASAFLNG